MLFAEGDGTRLALGCSRPFLARSVGFVGVSDGWQLLQRDGQLTDEYDRAADGNVALTAEIAATRTSEFRLALGFGRTAPEAASAPAPACRRRSTQTGRIRDRTGAPGRRSCARSTARSMATTSTASAPPCCAAMKARPFPGGLIASLSIPWGGSKGDDDLGGYHLVWPRDLAQTAGAFLACGAHDEVQRVVRYLRAIQEDDGSWPQNCWLDGTPYWHGVQLDECAFPILLLDMAWREGAMPRPMLPAYWPMVRARGRLRHVPRAPHQPGPLGGERRLHALHPGRRRSPPCWPRPTWPKPATSTASPTSCATPRMPGTSRSRTGSTSTDTRARARGRRVGLLRPHRARSARRGDAPNCAASWRCATASPGTADVAADDLVSTDALALVRFGLRAADDPRMRRHGEGHRPRAEGRSAVRARLAALQRRRLWRARRRPRRTTAPASAGPGRCWPASARTTNWRPATAPRRRGCWRRWRPAPAPASCCPSRCGTAPPIPERELEPGRPSGSAMPLVWAHAEHIKLLRSLADGAVFDLPPQPVRRYLRDKHDRALPALAAGLAHRQRAGRAGAAARSAEPALVHWSTDGWRTRNNARTEDIGLGIHTRRSRPRGWRLAVRLYSPGSISRRRRGPARTTR